MRDYFDQGATHATKMRTQEHAVPRRASQKHRSSRSMRYRLFKNVTSGERATLHRAPVVFRNHSFLARNAGTAHGEKCRTPGCRASDPRCRSQRFHRARNTHHRGRGISLSGERGGLAVTRFAQQSPSGRLMRMTSVSTEQYLRSGATFEVSGNCCTARIFGVERCATESNILAAGGSLSGFA